MIADSSVYSLKDRQFPLEIIHLEHERLTQRHSHDFYEFVYVERGFSLHRAQGSTSMILPGDLLAVPPGVEHEYWKSVNNSVYNCIFYPSLLGESLRELSELPLLNQIFNENTPTQWYRMHLNALQRQQAAVILREMEAELNTNLIGHELRLQLLLTDFLIGLSRAWHVTSTEEKAIKERSSKLVEGIIQTVDQFDSDAARQVGVEELARKAACSPEHYSRSFKKLTGMPPSSFILSMKLARAAEYLLKPDYSISHAAEQAGFDDVNYFARAFKKETGMTPTEFKNRNVNGNYFDNP